MNELKNNLWNVKISWIQFITDLGRKLKKPEKCDTKNKSLGIIRVLPNSTKLISIFFFEIFYIISSYTTEAIIIKVQQIQIWKNI